MRCDERQCDCGAVVAVYATILRAGEPDRLMCLSCLDLDVLHADTESGLVEARCEQCKNLFATDAEHTTFFCSLTCEQAWRAGKSFERIPF